MQITDNPTGTVATIVDHASPRPWTYHNVRGRDWIEDANGNVVKENIGHLDGPLICIAVNRFADLGRDEQMTALWGTVVNHGKKPGELAKRFGVSRGSIYNYSKARKR